MATRSRLIPLDESNGANCKDLNAPEGARGPEMPGPGGA